MFTVLSHNDWRNAMMVFFGLYPAVCFMVIVAAVAIESGTSIDSRSMLPSRPSCKQKASAYYANLRGTFQAIWYGFALCTFVAMAVWVWHWFTAPSSERETLFFALQVVETIVIATFIGMLYRRERKRAHDFRPFY